jgi:hypothetical protein
MRPSGRALASKINPAGNKAVSHEINVRLEGIAIAFSQIANEPTHSESPSRSAPVPSSTGSAGANPAKSNKKTMATGI